jgi:cell division protein FtsB
VDRNSATARASARRKRKNNSRLGIIGIIVVVLAFSCVLARNIYTSKQTLKELTIKEEKLIKERDEQLELQEELNERSVYVQTKAYVEEVAKELGLVYPDEVIFKPTEEND